MSGKRTSRDCGRTFPFCLRRSLGDSCVRSFTEKYAEMSLGSSKMRKNRCVWGRQWRQHASTQHLATMAHGHGQERANSLGSVSGCARIGEGGSCYGGSCYGGKLPLDCCQSNVPINTPGDYWAQSLAEKAQIYYNLSVGAQNPACSTAAAAAADSYCQITTRLPIGNIR